MEYLTQGVPAQHASPTKLEVTTLNALHVRAGGSTKAWSTTGAPRWRVQEHRGVPPMSTATMTTSATATATLAAPPVLSAGALSVGKIGAVVAAGND